MACAYNRHRLTEPAIHTKLPTIINTLAISRKKPKTELPWASNYPPLMNKTKPIRRRNTWAKILSTSLCFG